MGTSNTAGFCMTFQSFIKSNNSWTFITQHHSLLAYSRGRYLISCCHGYVPNKKPIWQEGANVFVNILSQPSETLVPTRSVLQCLNLLDHSTDGHMKFMLGQMKCTAKAASAKPSESGPNQYAELGIIKTCFIKLHSGFRHHLLLASLIFWTWNWF